MAIRKVIEIDVDQVKAMGGLDALEKNLKDAEKSGVSLREELRRLKDQLTNLEEGTAEYDKISRKAGEVSDKIGDMNTRIKALGSDTRGIDTVVQGAQAISGAFSIATSASALLGEENEDLQKAMLKVEGAIGLTVGIQSVANALQKDTALAMGLQTVATKVQAAAQTGFNFVVGTSTGLLKAFKIALATTGVGALVVGLGLLIQAMSSMSDATEDETAAQNNLNASLERYKNLLADELKGIDYVSKARLLRAQIAGKSEQDLAKIESEASEERLQAYKNEEARLLSLQKNKSATVEQAKKINDDLLANGRAYAEELQRQELTGLEKTLDAENKKREGLEKEAERREKLRQEELEKIRQFNESVRQGLLELQLAKENEFFVDRERQTQEAEIRQENLDNAVAQIEAMETKEREEAAKTLEYKRILREQEVAIAANTMGKIAELLGRNSKLGKAFAVGQALINTYQGITAELATKAVTPYEIGLKVINVAYIAKTGFDAVKRIVATNPMAGGGGSGSSSSSGGGGASAPAPEFNIVGQSATNQLTQTIAGQQNRPVQAFVVGSEVTTQQALDRNAQSVSTFG